jgi:hypothetical protein
MIEINYEARQKASKQADHERDGLIRSGFAEYQIEIVFDRSNPQPPNAKYDVRDLVTGRMFIIHDRRTITCGPLLAADIREQLNKEGALRV